MQVCTSLQTDNHASTPLLCFYRPDALPVSLPQWHTVGSTDVCSVCVWQAVDASGTPLCLHCHTPYQSSLIDKSSVDQNPWLTRLCSRQCMQQFWVVMHVSCSLQSACVKCNLWTFNRLTPGLWKYWNLKPANLRSSKSLNVKVLFESAWKVLECDLLGFFWKFWLDNGRLFTWTFRHVTMKSCNVVVFFLDYLHTRTHPFNCPFSGTTWVSRYQKGKTNLDFTEPRDSEWQWHQLGHMQVCTLLQTDNYASTPPLSFWQAGCPSCRPTNSVRALKSARNR